MKTILKIVLLGLFAAVIFLPSEQFPSWAYWSLFVCMFIVLIIYYYTSYWVSVADVLSTDSDPIKFSVFAGKVPPLSSEDLVRGRLVVTDTEVRLYQRPNRKSSNLRAREVWKVSISSLDGFTLGRVIGMRNGLILSLTQGDEARFAIFFMKKRKADLITALGWDDIQSK